jgi:ribosome-associated protein
MDKINEVKIKTKEIKLDQFLKWANISASGGEAKELIVSGDVTVNNIVETKRGRKLKHEDVVGINNQKFFKVISLT